MTTEQIDKLEKLCKNNPAGITYKADYEYSCIEFYIAGECLATWCYEDAEGSFDEFKRVYYSAWIASRDSLCVTLPCVKGKTVSYVEAVDDFKSMLQTAGINYRVEE
jgi:hypothetical protein